MSKTERKQINLRTDEDFLRAVGELQRLDDAAIVPTMSDVIRDAVFRELARRKADRRGGRKP